MKRADAFPSKYLSKDDLAKPLLLTIRGIEKEKMPGDDGEAETVISFGDDAKPMILNVTNWMTCEELYGEDSDTWIGKHIEVYWEQSVFFGGKKVGGKRVRKPSNANGNENTPESLKALRERIRAAGGNPPALHSSDIDTPEKIAQQISLHQSAYAEQLAKTI